MSANFHCRPWNSQRSRPNCFRSIAHARAASSPDTRKRLLEQGAEPVGNTPEQFQRELRDEVARWAEVVKVSGAKAD